MDHEIKTERLVIRPHQPEDAPVIIGAFNDWSVTKWLARVAYPFRPEDLRLTGDDGSSRWPESCAITLGGEFVGAVSLSSHLGYWIKPDYWGRGIASEAARARINYQFRKTAEDHIVSGYFVGNAGSARVLQRLGFRQVGQSKQFAKSHGIVLDHVDMRLDRADWEARS